MERAIWSLKDVGVRGAGRPRLDGVTLEIAPGVTAIRGPSGAGKTTLLNLLVGFEKADEGTVEFEGSGFRVQGSGASSDGPPFYWCPPDHGLWPHLSVREHLEAAACAGRRGKIGETLRAFDLDDHAGQRPDHLSQGQRSRLSVARALLTGARALVMDEPLVHVDEEASPRYWECVMETVKETGASLVFCTHNGAAAERHADRVVTLRGGRLVALAMLLLVGLVVPGCDKGSEPVLAVKEVRQITLPSDGHKAPRPRDMAAYEDGQVLAIDNAGRVVVLDRGGAVVRMWKTPTNEHGNPEGVLRLRDGRIAVADTHYFRVLFFDAGGKLLSSMGSEGDGPGQFRFPVKVAEDDAGNIYVAEYGGNDRVQKFAPDGKFILSMGSPGTGDGQFQRPGGIVWHAGKLYIGDAINNRILIFSDGGQFLGRFAEGVSLDLPYDLARGADGNFYVIEYGGRRLTVIDGAGRLVGRYDAADRGGMSSPWGVEADAEGIIWIADTENGRILRVER